MNPVLMAVGGTLAAAVALPRLLFLAPFRIGWAMYLANVAWELLPKKLGVGRFRLEAAAGAAGLAHYGRKSAFGRKLFPGSAGSGLDTTSTGHISERAGKADSRNGVFHADIFFTFS